MLVTGFKAGTVSTAAGLATARLDPLCYGDNNGVRFIADLGFGGSFPGGSLALWPTSPAAPGSGATIYDLAERANGSWIWNAADTGSMSYAGGGFDFSAVNNRGDYLSIPASVSADLRTTVGGVKDRYLICAYIKTPSLANWTASTEFLNWDSTNSSPCKLTLTSVAGTLGYSRRVTGSTVSGNLALNSSDVGSAPIQIALWRDPVTGQNTFRIKGPATGALVTSNSNATDPDADYTSLVGQFGAPTLGWPIGGAQRTGFRIYRVWIENLARSLRNPVTVLDADYARVITNRPAPATPFDPRQFS